jgi:hypothetical protein
LTQSDWVNWPSDFRGEQNANWGRGGHGRESRQDSVAGRIISDISDDSGA